MANAAATTPQPGWVCEGECESSVSSAWPSMPFASAALTAAVTTRLPTTQASFAPARAFANEIAFFPGGRREPERIAERVTRRGCFGISSTPDGDGPAGALVRHMC